MVQMRDTSLATAAQHSFFILVFETYLGKNSFAGFLNQLGEGLLKGILT